MQYKSALTVEAVCLKPCGVRERNWKGISFMGITAGTGNIEGRGIMSTIFREKNMERINSPEEMNDYIKVASPGVWMVLLAIIFLLIGVVVWGIFGTVGQKDADGQVLEVHPIEYVLN